MDCLAFLEKVGQVGKVGDVGKGTAKWMQSELTKEQESVENEFQDVRKIVVTDAVANLVAAMSKFMESEGGTKQVENVVKDAHEVGGVLWRCQSHVAKATPCCSTRHEHSYHDYAALVTISSSVFFLKPEQLNLDNDERRYEHGCCYHHLFKQTIFYTL